MRIAIASDLHLGFGKGSERNIEAFEQAKQAFEIALKEKVDLLLLPGDLFDKDLPSQETWVQAFQLFSLMKNEKRENVLVKKKTEQGYEDFKFQHIPVIAIAGTHEFRSKDFKNALDVLQEAGCLTYLHKSTAELEVNGEKLVVHGLSGVPEKNALEALQDWNPEPVPGALNILVLHQSIKEFLPFDDEMVASISLDDLPNNFDLVVNGHLHLSSEKDIKGKRFVLPGSTVITQMKKLEAEKEKGLYLFDSKNNALKFVPLPDQRKFFYETIEFKEADNAKVQVMVEEKLNEFVSKSPEKKPLIKLKLKGSLAKGLAASNIDLASVLGMFSEKALVSVDKQFEEDSFKEKLAELRQAQQGKRSIASMGFELLQKNLEQTNFKNAFDVKRVFDLLSEGELDMAVELLSRPESNPKS